MQAATCADGPWRPSGVARPLLWWTSEQLGELALYLDRALSEWRRAWGIAAPEQSLSCQLAKELPCGEERWKALSSDGEPLAWLRFAPQAGMRIAKAMFPGESAGPITASLAEAGLADAAARLASALGLQAEADAASAPPPSGARAWSGVVETALPGIFEGQLLIGGAAMQAWCAARKPRAPSARSRTPREPLRPASEALAGKRVSLQVQLQGCELDLGTVQGLHVGDLVRLRHSLETPATLTDPSGEKLLAGYLGRQRGLKAVELVPIPQQSPTPPTTNQILP
jgi:hypothetical protein